MADENLVRLELSHSLGGVSRRVGEEDAAQAAALLRREARLVNMSEMGEAIATMRDCYLPLGGIAPAVPLWLTENGYASSKDQATQTAALTGMIDAVHKLSGKYNVTDYRWFNLRDNDSTGNGTFDQDGLLLDDYAQKSSYAAFYAEIVTGS